MGLACASPAKPELLPSLRLIVTNYWELWESVSLGGQEHLQLLGRSEIQKAATSNLRKCLSFAVEVFVLVPV